MQHLIILHGAIGQHQQLQPLAALLQDGFEVHNLNFSGHGGKAFSEHDFSINLFAGEVVQYMDENNIDNACIFGYSMGGYVGMYIAKYFPGRVKKIITLATKFHWDEAIAAKECKMLDSEKIEEKLPSFAQYLQQGHAPNDWKVVLQKTKEMLIALGRQNALNNNDYSNIEIPALLILGDRDKMVTIEETISVYKTLPNAQMAMLPGTPHPIEQVKPDLLKYWISLFLSN